MNENQFLSTLQKFKTYENVNCESGKGKEHSFRITVEYSLEFVMVLQTSTGSRRCQSTSSLKFQTAGSSVY